MSQMLPFLTQDPLPPSKNRRSPIRWTVVALGLIALVLAGVWVAMTVRGLAPEEASSVTAGQTVLIVVETGDSLSTLAQSLETAGVVTSASAFLASASSCCATNRGRPANTENRKTENAADSFISFPRCEWWRQHRLRNRAKIANDDGLAHCLGFDCRSPECLRLGGRNCDNR